MKDNKLCKLCKDSMASSEKSHIFSHFFIKSMLNPIGNTKRGIGRSFQISGNSGSKTFFERNVSINDFERLFENQELTEGQLMVLKMDPYSMSHLLCPKCEDRMSIVENYFNDNVFKKIDASDSNFLISAMNSNNLLIRLFFLSMIWRASAAKFDNFKLPINIEEKLRIILNQSIGNGLTETLDLTNTNSGSIISEGLFCCTTRFFCDITANQITILDNGYPYYFEINEYAICYFPNISDLTINQDIFGLEKYINTSTININEDRFKICLIDSSDWNQKRNLLFQFAASKFTEYLRSKFIHTYIKKFRKKPKLISVQSFMIELISGKDTTIALRYTDKRIDSLIEKHLKNDA